MMKSNSLTRRDMLLMSSGAAALCVGRLADGFFPSSAFGSAAGLDGATGRLQRVPESFGAWTSEPGEISDRELIAASIHSYLRRDYRNTDSGYTVSMTLLCGPAGPMAVHPPTACFEGVGYTLLNGPVMASLPQETAGQYWQFNRSTFRQDESTIPQTVRVFWGWSTDGNWQAPSRPRLAYRGEPWLYKLYVIDRSTLRRGAPSVRQAESFLADALPVLQQALQPGSPAAVTV